jgi:hypothetical protein
MLSSPLFARALALVALVVICSQSVAFAFVPVGSGRVHSLSTVGGGRALGGLAGPRYLVANDDDDYQDGEGGHVQTMPLIVIRGTRGEGNFAQRV